MLGLSIVYNIRTKLSKRNNFKKIPESQNSIEIPWFHVFPESRHPRIKDHVNSILSKISRTWNIKGVLATAGRQFCRSAVGSSFSFNDSLIERSLRIRTHDFFSCACFGKASFRVSSLPLAERKIDAVTASGRSSPLDSSSTADSLEISSSVSTWHESDVGLVAAVANDFSGFTKSVPLSRAASWRTLYISSSCSIPL